MESLLKFKATAALVLVNCLVMIYYDNTQIPNFALKEMGSMKLVQTAFYHMNRLHFTYNTMSLICKGMWLEQQMGSAMFGFATLALAFLSQTLIAVLASISEYIYPAGNAHVGFSAVIFSLKVLVNELDDEPHGGLNAVCWIEGFVVPFLFPDRAIIVGLLCGFVAGYIYIYVTELLVPFLDGNIPADFGLPYKDYSDSLSWICPSCENKNGVYFEKCNNCSQARSCNN